MTNVADLPNVIEPSKCLLEDFEIISFEKEEHLDYYSFWNDKLRGKSFDDLIRQQQEQSQQEKSRSSQRNASQRLSASRPTATPINSTPSRSSSSKRSSSHRRQQQQPEVSQHELESESLLKTPAEVTALAINTSTTDTNATISTTTTTRFHPTKPGNGLEILNSNYYKTLPDGKVLMKYKLTKLYNKFRGRQSRRNMVLERQRMKRIEIEVAKGQLNSWLAYTALQALRLPESNVNQLSTIAINNNPKFITIPHQNSNSFNTANGASGNTSPSKKKCLNKKQAANKSAPPLSQAPPMVPMHLVYIDPNDIVTYSNRINPQQIVSYRRRSHLLPSSATSKKSSAASYDVYEIMEVLANTDKTNVTITRNANKPAPSGLSIYSHSINANTPGIVSTQLHLQAKAYLDSVGKYYAEESIRLKEEEEKLRNEPSLEEQISKYIKIDHTYSTDNHTGNNNHDTSTLVVDKNDEHDLSDLNNQTSDEDVIDQLEEDIMMMLRPQKTEHQPNGTHPAHENHIMEASMM